MYDIFCSVNMIYDMKKMQFSPIFYNNLVWFHNSQLKKDNEEERKREKEDNIFEYIDLFTN